MKEEDILQEEDEEIGFYEYELEARARERRELVENGGDNIFDKINNNTSE